MKCLGFFVATIILCQIEFGITIARRRRDYFEHNYNLPESIEDDTYIHPPWWRGTKHHSTVQPSGPFDVFGIDHGDSSEESSEKEERPPIRDPAPSHSYGGHRGWSRPWGFQTTKRPYPGFPFSTEKTLNKSEQTASCIQSCSITSEYNPVCGSNNVTYTNPGRLECAQKCGVVVQLSKLSPCNESETTESTIQKTEEQMLACIRSCPVTGEYNPVCGSNNVTYANPGRLECAQNCGLKINVSRHTSCTAPLTRDEINSINDKRDVIVTMDTTTELNIPATNSSTPRPFINANSNLDLGNVENNSNNVGEENFTNVGTDGNVTNEENEMKNENSNANNNENNSDSDNEGNQFSEENNGAPGAKGYYGGGNYGGNSGHGVNNFHGGHGGNNGNNGHYPGNNNNNCNGVNNQRVPSVKDVMECMQLCTLTSEFNPVCGTDSITYTNPGRLLCAQFCGIDVRVKKFAPCSSSSNTNFHCPTICTNPPVTDNPGTPPPPTNAFKVCMETCPASTEYKPVCGTNNITYTNLEKLQCARRCGVDVSVLRNTDCFSPVANPTGLNIDPPVWSNTEKPTNPTSQVGQDTQDCIKQCSVPPNYDPICGSDNVTYNNTGHLICARECGLDVRLKRLFPCTDDGSPSPNPTTEKEQVSPGQNGLNFTISPDVLANIWSETTTSKDDSEEFEIDQRIQDES